MESYIGEIIAGILAIAGMVAGAAISTKVQGFKEIIRQSRKAQLKALKCVNYFFAEEKMMLGKLAEADGQEENSLKDEYREAASEETKYRLPYEPGDVKMKIQSLEERLT
ncbi:MAG: hypothetical protein CL877_07820 [Dehalococcoidales bacterium]|nr:hypothetical protein [Dehalococcoidales bacterium]